jgi:hypothetical protein
MTEWKLVPVDPTDEMTRFGSVQTEIGGSWREGSTLNDAEAATCYTAMLAAAPQASEDEELVERVARALRFAGRSTLGDPRCLLITRAILAILDGNHEDRS